MAFRSPDFHEKSFRIKHEDERFLTKLLSKESSKSNPSFRVYYGDVPSAVPFTWETRPGTPKMGHFDENVAPPLTPPPSFYTNANLNASSTKTSKSNIFLHTILRRISHNKSSDLASSPSSSSFASFSFSSFRDPSPANYRRRRFSSWGGERAVDSPGFGIGKGYGDEKKETKKKCRGYNSSVYVVKKIFLAIVGLRSAA